MTPQGRLSCLQCLRRAPRMTQCVAVHLPVTLLPSAQAGPARAEMWGEPRILCGEAEGDVVLEQLMRVRIPLRWHLEADVGPAQAHLPCDQT